MSRQDKATTDRHARILRDLVKQPDNKNCADCRKNDARWASWNLGVYVCIRCSGIHRSMGTHISKGKTDKAVKSIDLDIWTPEQMDNIKKWGNKRANLYWEKHLKAGHVPPDHKIESFIRSKYESRRWAMEGPPPADPSVLENGGSSSSAQQAPTPTSSAPPAAPASLPRTHPLLSRTAAPTRSTPSAPSPAPAPAPAPMVDLFGDDPPSLGSTVTTPPRSASSSGAPAATTAAAAPGPTATTAPANPTSTSQPQAPAQQQSNIFDLDFRTPTPTSASSKPQTAKADIMSLFSTAQPMVSPPIQSTQPAPAQNAYASWNGGITSSAPPQQQQQNQASLSGMGGMGGWGMADQNAWGSTATPNSTSTSNAHVNGGASASNANANPWGGSAYGGPGASAGAGSGFGSGAAAGGAGGYGANAGGLSGMSGMSGMGMSMGADPWATPAPAPAAQTGNQSAGYGGLSAAQAKKAEHDPFANIWQ